MSEYLVEVYVSRRAASQLPTQDVISGVAAELTRAGKQVNFVRSILLPDDETCLYHFEGDSDAVREVAVRSGLQVERVVEAVSERSINQDGNVAVAANEEQR